MNEQEFADGPVIIVLGNPVDGLQFVGPFETYDDAIDYADKHNLYYLVAGIEAPEEDEDTLDPNDPSSVAFGSKGSVDNYG